MSVTPRHGLAAALAVVLGLAVSACGSSSSGGAASSSPSAPAAATSSGPAAGASTGPAVAASASGAPAASGTPIAIAGAGPLTSPIFSEPEFKSGMQAAIASINAAGGVKGHPLSLNFCDTGYTVNGELTCARKIVAAKPAAAIGPLFLADQSGAEFTLLAKAGIPAFGTEGVSPAELTSPDVYPLASGAPGQEFGAADGIVRAGAKKVVVVADTDPASQFGAQLITSALKLAGITAPTVTGDATSDPTFSTAAAKAIAGGTDGIVLTPGPADNAKLIAALRQAGYTGKLSTPASLLPQESVDALKGAAEGTIVNSQTALSNDTSNAGVQKFIADMKQYESSAMVDDRSLTGWSAVELFAKAIAGATSFDAAGITAGLNALSTPVDIGTVAPYAIAGRTSPVPMFSRLLNPTVTFGVVKNGKVVADGSGFVNPFTSLAAGK